MLDRKINVLCVDDHTLYRKGSVMLMQSLSQVDEVFEAENGLEALKYCSSLEIDVVLLDLDMPIMDGVETSKRILEKHKGIRVIIISQHEELSMIARMIEIGVHAYLVKSASPSEVEKAIEAVMSSDFYYSQLVSNALRNKVQNDSGEKQPKDEGNLTKRELEVLKLICEELTMKEIGEKLFISEQTIQTHRKNLMKKIDVHTGVGLVKFAINHNIITI